MINPIDQFNINQKEQIDLAKNYFHLLCYDNKTQHINLKSKFTNFSQILSQKKFS